MNIVWSAQSRRDLKSIQEFISRDSGLYVQRQLARLIERVEYVADMPTMGHPVHECPESGLRETHEGSYRIIYSHDDTQ